MDNSLVEKIKTLLEENGVNSGGMIILMIPATVSINPVPPKRISIPKTVKAQLWKCYFKNKGKGKCYCCDEKILSLGSWEAGHVIAQKYGGGDEIDNLRPVCSTCNKSMGTMNMDEFKKRYFPVNQNDPVWSFMTEYMVKDSRGVKKLSDVLNLLETMGYMLKQHLY